ncbi:hypothetical protein [Bacillus weihaiensis]|uniref:Uncharacterized protein n=1 Tax=Bacillus weihaiensis TaxID=1547283 RepID=A0A1L3MR96_9BACI|nr:hypothetical protein [Bacillus weihaiensis]APH04885.1 hypothetical protein A9C19_09060 [Bacillus weihaiensis]
MPMEQETMTFLINGIGAVIVIFFLTVMYLLFFFRKGRSFRWVYGMVLAFIFFLVISILNLKEAIGIDYKHPMASEEITYRLGLSGLLFSASLLFLLVGLLLIPYPKAKLHKK